MPIVSVLIPVYNREKYIAQAIQSILSQTFRDFELIVINDGSTDKTEEVICGFNSIKIRYYKNEHNLGIAATRNKGLELAKGKYLAMLDSDDIAMPNRLKVQVEYMESHPEIVISGTFYKQFGSGARLYYKLFKTDNEIKSFLIQETSFLQPTIIMRLDKIRKSEVRYSEEYSIAEDYDFFERVAAKTDGNFANLKCKLTKYRRHSENSFFPKRPTVTARRNRKKIRTRRIKALLGKDYSTRYPILMELIYSQKISNMATILESMKFLKLLEEINKKKKIYSIYHFNKHIEMQLFFLIKYFLLVSVKNIFKMNFNLASSKAILKIIIILISEKKTFRKKIILIFSFFINSIKTIINMTLISIFFVLRKSPFKALFVISFINEIVNEQYM